MSGEDRKRFPDWVVECKALSEIEYPPSLFNFLPASVMTSGNPITAFIALQIV